jgi:cyclophilin family peptidyl-prolyl cis-trans isomerase
LSYIAITSKTFKAVCVPSKSVFKKSSKAIAAACLSVFVLTACSSDDKKEEQLDYPVLANDNVAAIDVARGDYACVDIDTSFGLIKVALDTYYAPKTTANFRSYVSTGFYDGLIFHRVISNFMIQGGGFDDSLTRQATMAPIKSESKNGLRNYRGRIAMARTAAPHSATSQFYINVVDNPGLDQPNAGDGVGYTVFGGVIEGMDVVDQIKDVETGSSGNMRDVPLNDVFITSALEVECPAT